MMEICKCTDRRKSQEKLSFGCCHSFYHDQPFLLLEEKSFQILLYFHPHQQFSDPGLPKRCSTSSLSGATSLPKSRLPFLGFIKVLPGLITVSLQPCLLIALQALPLQSLKCSQRGQVLPGASDTSPRFRNQNTQSVCPGSKRQRGQN